MTHPLPCPSQPASQPETWRPWLLGHNAKDMAQPLQGPVVSGHCWFGVKFTLPSWLLRSQEGGRGADGQGALTEASVLTGMHLSDCTGPKTCHG